jgi:hypothetical protein
VSAAERIRRQLESLTHMRGLGPVANDSARWIDQTSYLLVGIFGESSPEVDSFLQAVSAMPADRQEQPSALNLPLEGPWGIRARLERGEGILRAILGRLEVAKDKEGQQQET